MPPQGNLTDRARQRADERRTQSDQLAAEALPPGTRDRAGAEIARPDPMRQLMKAFEPEIQAQLPKTGVVDPEAFMRAALTGIKTSKQAVQLANCTRPSLFAALLECARLGLMPFSDEGAIVPFGNQATFIPQYQGFVTLFYRTGQVARVVRNLIYQADDWDLAYGDNGGFYHKPNLIDRDTGEPVDRGKAVLAYCYLVMRDGTRTEITTCTRWQAEEIRDRYSKSYQNAEQRRISSEGRYGGDSTWHTDFDKMWLKHLSVDTPIPTPSGWSTMGQLQPGDLVLDRDGQPVRVTAKSAVRTDKQCFEIRFRTGDPIVCSDEHVWVAKVGRYPRGPAGERAWTTAELAEAKAAGRQVVIPVAEPLDVPAADLPVDPWVLGYWLGNGKRGSGQVCCNGDDTAEVVTAIASAGYQLGTVRPDPVANATVIGVHGLAKPLAGLGVLGDKHVPAVYLRGSAAQRLALLRGLMDSDGSVWQRKDAAGRAKFTSTRPQLRDAVAELARSLGEQVMCEKHDVAGFGKTVRAYTVSWTPTAEVPFALTRKGARSRLRSSRSYGHRVKSVTPVAPVPVACIAVDSPTRTYLAGTAMVPTHNTAIRMHAPIAPKSPELITLLMLDRRDDTRPDVAALAPPPPAPPMPPADSGVDWTKDLAGNTIQGAVVTGEDARDAGGWPAGAAPAAGQEQAAEPGGGGDRVLKAARRDLNIRFSRVGWAGDAKREDRLLAMAILARPGVKPPVPLESTNDLDVAEVQDAIGRFDAWAAQAAEKGREWPGVLQEIVDAARQAAQDAAPAAQDAGQ